MNRPLRKYVERFEAMDLSAGIYHARRLPRARYNRNDFLDYLSALELDAFEEDFQFDVETLDVETLEAETRQ